MGFLLELGGRAAAAGRRVVLAEGDDDRVRQAALRLQKDGYLDPTLLVADASTDAPAGWKGAVRCPADDPELDRYAELYRPLRDSRGMSLEKARERAADPLIFSALMLQAGDADGAVAGVVHSTADVVRAALHGIGTAPGTRTVTGAFYMVAPHFIDQLSTEVLTFADAGVVPDPDVAQLVEIAGQAAEMRRVIVGDEPRLAFLSYSTLGSAEGPSVEKMRRALDAFRDAHPGVAADGELQVDAALVESVGRRKAPDSPVAGRANVLIFPDLASGNIAYKLVERLAGATAIGPILHGLARPFNDLSRGADPAAIEAVAYVTAIMAGP
ncbi:MAG: phosphate acyltransferase [Myxococcota bacterium]